MASCLSIGLVLFSALTFTQAARIVGGQDTTIEQYPSLVQVESWTLGFWSQSCGANILTRNFLLSAAHCFEGLLYRPRFRRIRAGSTIRNFGGDIHYVDYEVNHPNYRRAARFDADISIFKLRTPLILSPVIQQGTIVVQGSPIPDNLPVVHAGWGATRWGGFPALILQHVTIFTINNQLCTARYAAHNPNDVVTPNMICAGILDVGGKDACQGDSGGPLYYEDMIIGVVSWGHRCANDTLPGVSTSVASYSDWIIANAR